MSIIITLCLLLLLAYIFDLSSSKTKIPSVILLLLLGWGVKQIVSFFNIPVPNLTSALPILGTIGLVLIVLEGSLELEEVQKFKELTSEMTFLIRTLFFLLFGYLLETTELLNTNTLIWAIAITAGIFIIRGLLIWLFRLHFKPLFYMAPRGLITILLFLSIPLTQTIPIINKSLIVQVIVLSSLVMMYGLMRTHTENDSEESSL